MHCLQCAFIATTTRDAVTHVTANPDHTVTGPGPLEGTTLTISNEQD